MMAEGRHYYKNGKHYVLYDDETVSPGHASATVLKIGRDSMTLLRHGDIMQEQYFAEARESKSVYRTPYGNLDLSVKTEKIDIVYGTVSGNIDVVYAMAINGEWQSNNELHIEVCADQEESQKLN